MNLEKKDFKIIFASLFIIGLFFGFFHNAFGQTAPTDQTTFIEQNDVFIIFQTFDTLAGSWGGFFDVSSIPDYVITGATVTTPNGNIFSVQFTDTIVNFGFDPTAGDLNSNFIGNWNIEIQGNFDITLNFSLDSNYILQNFTITAPATINQTWGNAGIWGDEITDSEIIETMTASVITTGSNLWPLLVFSGVALAFIIFLQIRFLSQKSVRINRNRAVFDDKKADDLKSFYSKDGKIDKDLKKQIKKL